MKAQKILLAFGTALLFGAAGAFAQSSSGGTTTGTTSTTTTSTSTGTTSGTTSTGTTTGTTSTGTTSTDDSGTDAGSSHAHAGGSANAGAHGQAAAHEHVVNPNASANAQAVQTILAKYDANRDQYIAARQAIITKLQAATTDADRQAALAELKAEMQTEKDSRTQLGKEIRDELKTLRQQRKTGGG